jgi:MFS family permease
LLTSESRRLERADKGGTQAEACQHPATRYHCQMVQLLLTAFALGVASLDFTATVLALGALGAGARNRALLAFGCVCILGTLVFGTTLSLVIGTRLAGLDWSSLLPHDPAEDLIAAIVEVLLGVGLVIWGIVRALRPTTTPPKPNVPRAVGLMSLASVGILFALAAIIDPPFLSLVVIAGRAEHFWSVVAAHSTWVIVSHAPLILLLVLAVSTDHDLVVDRFQTWWTRIRPIIVRLVTGTVLLAGALLLLDAAWFFVTGKLFLPT